jgi:hypothetical protein
MLNPAICPVCNGFAVLQVACTVCGGPAEDCGRLGDLYGPYSPYRPIDDIRMTNGYVDVRERECLHSAHCHRCGTTFVHAVEESDTFLDSITDSF